MTEVELILEKIRGNIFTTGCKHVVFGVNTDGHNDIGFAGQVTDKYWPELADTGGNKLGEVLSKRVGGKTFHALVCHELKTNGWTETPSLVEQCLNKLDVENEAIAIVLIGGGLIGQLGGADVDAILSAMESSTREVIVYTL